MTQEEIIEGNTAIGKWLDIPCGYKKYTTNPDDKGVFLFQLPSSNPEIFEFYAPEELKFHESWDALIEVCKSIRNCCIMTWADTDKMGDVYRALHRFDKEATYLSAVDFINENNTLPTNY